MSFLTSFGSRLFGSIVLFAVPLVASADSLSTFVGNITRVIIQPVILLLFALALFYFVSGLIPFILKSDDPEARKVGRGHLIWGIIGFFIMTSVVTILAIVTNTFCGVPFCTSQRLFP